MKIIIQRVSKVLSCNAQETMDYMQDVFKPIVQLGWIQDLSFTKSGYTEMITVNMLPEGDQSYRLSPTSTRYNFST